VTNPVTGAAEITVTVSVFFTPQHSRRRSASEAREQLIALDIVFAQPAFWYGICYSDSEA
jgi:hypothetical protein